MLVDIEERPTRILKVKEKTKVILLKDFGGLQKLNIHN